MNKKLLVTLLHKNLEELAMITASFQELDEYPQAIVQLARRKTEDIQTILDELAALPAVVVPLVAETPLVEVQKIDEPLEVSAVEIDELPHANFATEPTYFTEPVESPDLVADIADTSNIEPLLSTIEIDDLPDLTFAHEEPEIALEPTLLPDEIALPETMLVDELPQVDEEVLISETIETTLQLAEEQEVIALEIKELVVELPRVESENVELEVEHKVELSCETAPETTIIGGDEPKKMTISEKMGTLNTSRNDAMSNGQNSLSASIANKKITDIKQALSIGDRFRFQRELFKSNGEDMNRTLTYLNLLATQSEAMAFLQSKYSWGEGNEAAEDFYQLVKRKFL